MNEINKVILEQLEMLKTLEFQVDGKLSKDVPKSFSNIVFLKSDKQVVVENEHRIVFEPYVIQPFMDDFHNKFNNGHRPPDLVTFGNVLKESEKMYYIQVRNVSNTKTFIGWIPKKSMRIE